MAKLELEKLTDEMFDFIKSELGIEKKEVLTAEDDNELRLKIVDYFFDIEVDEVCACLDDYSKFSKRGKLATDIVTYLCYKPRDVENDGYYTDDDDE